MKVFGLGNSFWTKNSDQIDQQKNSTCFSKNSVSKQKYRTFYSRFAFYLCKNSISSKVSKTPKSDLGFAYTFILIANLLSVNLVLANPSVPNLPNALPTGAKVIAGAASITSSQTPTSATMTVNQSSQRAVVNWDSFNVGKNAQVTFNQPNANAVTLNRVTGATASMIEGALKANGQVVFVNPNGVTFGKGAEINAAGVVATTMDISNKDFMDGKGTYKGNGKGAVINEGKISTNTEGGYIALLAPEVRNDGYLLAKKGSGTVALAAGEQITLDFKGNSLMSVKVDVGTYNALIENKRVVEVNGGLVVIAAGSANQLMASVIKNTGRISANSMVNNGGTIELVANTVTQAGKITANSKTAEGGQINLVGNEITIASNSKTTATGATSGGQVNVGLASTQVSGGTQVNAPNNSQSTPTQTQAQIKANADQAASTKQLAQSVTIEQDALIDTSATQNGNGGAIAIWSQVKTTVAGILKSMGGSLSGNGGFIETSSKGTVNLGPTVQINTSANNATGNAGTWLLDPIDLTIDASTANLISAVLANSNVTIAVTNNTNVCPIGSCTQSGSGTSSLTIASGADILKTGTNLTTLTLSSAGIFNLNANISGQNLAVIISSSIAYLNVGTTITASEVTVQAQTIYSAGTIGTSPYSLANAGNTLGNAIKLLAQAIYVSGRLAANASPGVGAGVLSTAGTIKLNANTITLQAGAILEANGDEGGQITVAANDANFTSATIQVNGGNGRGGTLLITAANDLHFDGAQLLANGTTDGGALTITTTVGDVNLANSTIQTNGSSGRGGSIGLSATNITQIANSVISANGYTQGGTIKIGNDATGGSLPFSMATNIDANTTITAAQLDPNPSNTAGGYIETSGHTLNLLASINAGRGGMWLLDPYDVTIDSGVTSGGALPNFIASSSSSVVNASDIQDQINAGTSVTISATGTIVINASIAKNNLNGSAVLAFRADRDMIISSGVTFTDVSSANALNLEFRSAGGILFQDNQNPVNTINTHGYIYVGGLSVGAPSKLNSSIGSSVIRQGVYVGGNVSFRTEDDIVIAGKAFNGVNGGSNEGPYGAFPNYAYGVIVASSSSLNARNISIFGSTQSNSQGAAMQLTFGSPTPATIVASGSILIEGDASSTGSNIDAIGIYLAGVSITAPTISITGYSNKSSVPGISFGNGGHPSINTFTSTGLTTLTADRIAIDDGYTDISGVVNLRLSSVGSLLTISGNLGANNLSTTGNITVVGNLAVNGSSILNGDISSSGNQTYQGPVTLTKSITLNSDTGNIYFGSTVDSNTDVPKSLTVNAGAVEFHGNVGGIQKLSSLTVNASSPDGITIYGNISITDDTSLGSLLQEIYSGGYFDDNLSFFNGKAPTASGYVSGIAYGNGIPDYTNYRFSGYFRPKVSGVYQLTTTSDDSSLVYLGAAGQSLLSYQTILQSTLGFPSSGLVVNNSTPHGDVTVTGSTVNLVAGQAYPLVIYYANQTGGSSMSFAYQQPGTSSWISQLTPSQITLNGKVSLKNDVVITNQGGGNVSFNGALYGDGVSPRSLTVNTSGLGVVSFAGNSSDSPRLQNLTVNGLTSISGAINTNGIQTYNSPVTISNDIVLTGNEIKFDSTLNIDSNKLTLAADKLTFNAVVSGAGTLQLSSFSSAGTISIGETIPNTLYLSSSLFSGNGALSSLGSIEVGGTGFAGSIFVNDSTSDGVTFSRPITFSTSGSGFTQDISLSGKINGSFNHGLTFAAPRVTLEPATTIDGKGGDINFAVDSLSTGAGSHIYSYLGNLGIQTYTSGHSIALGTKTGQSADLVLPLNMLNGNSEIFGNNGSSPIAFRSIVFGGAYQSGGSIYIGDSTSSDTFSLVNDGTGFTFASPVYLTSNSYISSGRPISFASSINLIANSDPTITYGLHLYGDDLITLSRVGNQTPLSNLVVESVWINLQRSIKTYGPQEYWGSTFIGDPSGSRTVRLTSYADHIAFFGTVDDANYANNGGNNSLVVKAGNGDIWGIGFAGVYFGNTLGYGPWGVPLNKLTVKGNAFIAADIHTVGNQTYKGHVYIGDPIDAQNYLNQCTEDCINLFWGNPYNQNNHSVYLGSYGGNITFKSRVDDVMGYYVRQGADVNLADWTQYNSWELGISANEVSIKRKVGYDSPLQNLYIGADVINLGNSIKTYGPQNYWGSTYIGSPYGFRTVRLTSYTDHIGFFGTVDDANDLYGGGNNSLYVNATGNQDAWEMGFTGVYFGSTVGGDIPLNRLTVKGNTFIAGDIYTVGNQTYRGHVYIGDPIDAQNYVYQCTGDCWYPMWGNMYNQMSRSVSLTSYDGNITFKSRVDDVMGYYVTQPNTYPDMSNWTPYNAWGLSVTASEVTFKRKVGYDSPLKWLQVNNPWYLGWYAYFNGAAPVINIESSIKTYGPQEYWGSTYIGDPNGSRTVRLTSYADHIGFFGTVDDANSNNDGGNNSLYVKATGNQDVWETGLTGVYFDNTVGGDAPLNNLTVKGNTSIASDIYTVGNQTYVAPTISLGLGSKLSTATPAKIDLTFDSLSGGSEISSPYGTLKIQTYSSNGTIGVGSSSSCEGSCTFTLPIELLNTGASGIYGIYGNISYPFSAISLGGRSQSGGAIYVSENIDSQLTKLSFAAPTINIADSVSINANGGNLSFAMDSLNVNSSNHIYSYGGSLSLQAYTNTNSIIVGNGDFSANCAGASNCSLLIPTKLLNTGNLSSANNVDELGLFGSDGSYSYPFASITLGGRYQGSGKIYLSENISSNLDQIKFSSPTIINSVSPDMVIWSVGSIIFASTLNDNSDGHHLTLMAPEVSFRKKVGYETPLLSLEVNNPMYLGLYMGYHSGSAPVINLGNSIKTIGSQDYWGSTFIGSPNGSRTVRLTSYAEHVGFFGTIDDANNTNGGGNNSLVIRVNGDYPGEGAFTGTYFGNTVGGFTPLNNLTVKGNAFISADINTVGNQTYKGHVYIGDPTIAQNVLNSCDNCSQAFWGNGFNAFIRGIQLFSESGSITFKSRVDDVMAYYIRQQNADPDMSDWTQNYAWGLVVSAPEVVFKRKVGYDSALRNLSIEADVLDIRRSITVADYVNISPYSNGNSITVADTDPADGSLFLSPATLNKISANSLSLASYGSGSIYINADMTSDTGGALEHVFGLLMYSNEGIGLNANVKTYGPQEYWGSTYIGDPIDSRTVHLTSYTDHIGFFGTVDDANSANNGGNNSLVVKAGYGDAWEMGFTGVYFGNTVGGDIPLNRLTVKGNAFIAANINTVGNQTYRGHVYIGDPIDAQNYLSQCSGFCWSPPWGNPDNLNGHFVNLNSYEGSITFKSRVDDVMGYYVTQPNTYPDMSNWTPYNAWGLNVTASNVAFKHKVGYDSPLSWLEVNNPMYLGYSLFENNLVPAINIRDSIKTYGPQQYWGSTYIGDPNGSRTVRLTSYTDNIGFFGTVDDANSNINGSNNFGGGNNSLVVKAGNADAWESGFAGVYFGSTVGGDTPLNRLTVRGNAFVAADIYTVGNQTYKGHVYIGDPIEAKNYLNSCNYCMPAYWSNGFNGTNGINGFFRHVQLNSVSGSITFKSRVDDVMGYYIRQGIGPDDLSNWTEDNSWALGVSASEVTFKRKVGYDSPIFALEVNDPMGLYFYMDDHFGSAPVINIGSSIRTYRSQQYWGSTYIGDPNGSRTVRLTSYADHIGFFGTVDDANSTNDGGNNSLVIKANSGLTLEDGYTGVYFGNTVGGDTPLNRLTVRGNAFIAADIYTVGNQTYNGHVYIGEPLDAQSVLNPCNVCMPAFWGNGFNGYFKNVNLNSDSGSITFKSRVDDVMGYYITQQNAEPDMTNWTQYHAWGLSVNAGEVTFKRKVGYESPLQGLSISADVINLRSSVKTYGPQDYWGSTYIGSPDDARTVRLTSLSDHIAFFGTIDDANDSYGGGNNSLVVKTGYDDAWGIGFAGAYFGNAVGGGTPLNRLTVKGNAFIAADIYTVGNQTYKGHVYIGEPLYAQYYLVSCGYCMPAFWGNYDNQMNRMVSLNSSSGSITFKSRVDDVMAYYIRQQNADPDMSYWAQYSWGLDVSASDVTFKRKVGYDSALRNLSIEADVLDIRRSVIATFYVNISPFSNGNLVTVADTDPADGSLFLSPATLNKISAYILSLASYGSGSININADMTSVTGGALEHITNLGFVAPQISISGSINNSGAQQYAVDSLSINGSNTINAGSVTIAPFSYDKSVTIASIDPADGSLFLSPSTLNKISAYALSIISSSVGSIAVNADLLNSTNGAVEHIPSLIFISNNGTTLNSNIITTGSQRYDGPVILGNDISLTGGNLYFSGDVSSNGSYGLTINAANASFTNVSNLTQLYLQISNAANISGAYSGDGNLSLSGPGTLTLSGVNTYTGGTLIAQGSTLVLVGNGSIADSASINVDGIFDISGANGSVAIHSLNDLSSGAGYGHVSLGGNALIIGSNSGSGHFSGVIQDDGQTTGGISIVGDGYIQVFTGANTYSGPTNVSQGTMLALMEGGSIANSSSLNLDGTLSIFKASGPISIKALNDLTPDAGYGAVYLGSNTLTIGSAFGVGSFSGVIQDNGVNGGNIVITGDGYVQTLSGVNTYKGATNINQGATLALVGNGSIANSSAVNVDGVLDISGLGNYALLDLFNSDSSWSGDGTFYVTNTSISFMLDGNGQCGNGCPAPQSFTLAPSLGRSMILITPGGSNTDVTTIDQALSLTGGTMVSQVGNNTTNYGYITRQVYLGAGRYSFAWAYGSNDYLPFLDGVFFSISGPGNTNNVTLLARNGDPSYAGASGFPAGVRILPSFGSTPWIRQSVVAPVSGMYQISFGDFNHLDSDVNPYFFVSSSSGTYSGAPIVGGTSYVANLKNLTGSGTVSLGANTLNISNNSPATFSGSIVDGIQGSGGNLSIDAGVQRLSGANTYTGATNIAQGATLAIVGAGSIASSSVVNLNGTLDIQNAAVLNSLNMSNTAVIQNSSNGAANSSLTVQNASLMAGSITTTGSQDYFGQVFLSNDLALAGSNISFHGAIEGGSNLTISDAGKTIFAGSVGSVTPLATLSVNAGINNHVNYGAVEIYDHINTIGNQSFIAGSVFIAEGGSIYSDQGNVVINTGRFINASPDQLALNAPNGFWQIWSVNADPHNSIAGDQLGSLVWNYKQYNATYGVDDPLDTGNGYLSVYSPRITVSLTGSVNKYFDGNTDATMSLANYSYSGVAPGDSVGVASITSSVYVGAGAENAGHNKNIQVSGITLSTKNDGRPVYGYTLNNDVAIGSIGNILPKSIVIANSPSSTTYDGVTSYANLMAANGYSYTPLVGSDAIGSVAQTASIGGSAVTGIVQAGSFISSPSSALLSRGLADNYSFIYVGTSNDVAKANLAITAVESLTGNTYRGTPYTGTYTSTALGSDASSITVTGQASGVNVGTYMSNLSASGSVLSNYNTPVITNANFVISPAPLGIELTGTYSGTRNVSPSSFTITGLMNGDTVRSIASANLADSNVASNGANYVTSIAGVSGTAVMSNYYITTSYNSTPNAPTTNLATINPANLVITAANDAKFVTQTDTVGSANNCGLNTACAGGYMGVTYNGFVNGENKDVLTGAPSLSVIRTNSGTESAGVYAGVLKASGLSASNYNISYVNGDYIIAPAKTLLVRVTPAFQVYGSNPTYTLRAQYLDADNRTIVDLSPSVNGSAVSIADGASGGANFTLALAGATTSTSGNINVGGYNLTATNSSVTGNNFNSLTVVGSNTVIPYTLRPNQLGISGVTKVYDGNINIGGLVLNVDPTLSTVLGSGATKDQVTIIGSGTFDNRNVGTGKAIDVNLTLSGTDGRNYILENDTYSANIGTITQLNSVSYVGGVGGKWSTQSNWAGGAIPILNNVANVYIPVGSSVVYDVAAVNASGSMGSNIINNGTLTINESINTTIANSLSGSGTYAQTGNGILTIAGNNNQSNPGPLTGQISVATGKTLILTNADALGSGSILSDNGKVGLSADTILRSLTISGPVTLISDVRTLDSQQYGGVVTLKSGTAQTPMVISSQNGNVTFLSTVNSDAANRSLTINALAGKVTLTDSAGYLSPNRLEKGPSITDLVINAKDILLKADVYTLSTQVYNGAVVISDNGSNGLTRTFLSQDPSIIFLGTIDDSFNVTHTLNVKAISFDANQIPQVTFRGAIGSIVPLGGLLVVTEMHLDPDPVVPGTPAGDITIGAGISTIGPQTYSGNGIIFDPAPGAGPIILSTKDGAIELYGVNGLRNDFAEYLRPGNGNIQPVTETQTISQTKVLNISPRILGSYLPPLDPDNELFRSNRYGEGSKVYVGEPSTIVPCEAELIEECVKS